MEEDIQVTVAHLAEVFSALRSVLTPVFFRGIFAFLTWWVAACQLISSLLGIYFHQYLMLSWATPPVCRLCALRQANRDPEENTWVPPTQTRCASEGLILTGDHDVFGLRQRECWSIDLEAFLFKRMNLFATQALKINGESAEGKYEKLLKKVWKMFLSNTLLLQIESLNDFEELALFIQKFMWCNTKCLVSQGFVIRIFPLPALH